MGSPAKTVSMEKNSSTKWDLTWVEWIHSHINDLFLQSEIHYSAEISPDVSPRWDDFSHINSFLYTFDSNFLKNTSLHELSCREFKYCIGFSKSSPILGLLQPKTVTDLKWASIRKNQLNFWILRTKISGKLERNFLQKSANFYCKLI